MSTFAEQLDELIKDTVENITGDLIDEKISDAAEEFHTGISDDIENMKYECEQMIDSNFSDVKEDLLSEVDAIVNDTVNEKLEDFRNNTLKVSDDDMRVIKDYIKALIDERIRNVITTMYRESMKELNGFVQSIPPYKGS
jgi:DNA repair exonuclease SbcCD ATPase subunit